MSERSPAPSARPSAPDAARQTPPADVVEFIRFCHHRRHVGWPELYDEMCAVAARREFNGWDHDQLAEHGLTFSLTVLGPQSATPEADHRAIVQPAPGPA